MKSGSEFITPSVGLMTRNAAAPEVSSTGEVSPMPRATPRISAVARPGRAVGSTTCQTVRHRAGAEREARLAQAAGHDPEHDVGGPGDDRQHHHRERQGGGEAGARRSRAPR